MEGSRIPKPVPDYRLEELDNELLLYHPAQTKTIYLNETASLVWQLCDGERSEQDIVDLLRESFPEAADTVESDVARTLDNFREHGAIEFA
jgi:hypothetical protein